MRVTRITTGKGLLGIGLLSILSLCVIYLNHTLFHYNYVLVGVFRELLTIPCILAQPLLLLFAIGGLHKKKFKEKRYAQATVVILLLGIILTGFMFTSP